jgi:hypothetical protein
MSNGPLVIAMKAVAKERFHKADHLSVSPLGNKLPQLLHFMQYPGDTICSRVRLPQWSRDTRQSVAMGR